MADAIHLRVAITEIEPAVNKWTATYWVQIRLASLVHRMVKSIGRKAKVEVTVEHPQGDTDA